MKLFSRTCAAEGQVMDGKVRLENEQEYERRRRKANEYEYVQREFAYDSVPPSQYVPNTKSIESSFRESIAMSEPPPSAPLIDDGLSSEISGSESDDEYVSDRLRREEIRERRRELERQHEQRKKDFHRDRRKDVRQHHHHHYQTSPHDHPERKKESSSLSSRNHRRRDSSVPSPSLQRTPSKSKAKKKYADLRGLTDDYLVIDRVPTAQGYHSDDSAEDLMEEKSRVSRYSIGGGLDVEGDAEDDEDSRYFVEKSPSSQDRWQQQEKETLERKKREMASKKHPESVQSSPRDNYSQSRPQNRRERLSSKDDVEDRNSIVEHRQEEDWDVPPIVVPPSSKERYQKEIQRENDLSKKILLGREGGSQRRDGRPHHQDRKGYPPGREKQTTSTSRRNKQRRDDVRDPPPPTESIQVHVLNKEPRDRDRLGRDRLGRDRMGRDPRSEGSRIVGGRDRMGRDPRSEGSKIVGGSSYSKGKKAIGNLIGKMRGPSASRQLKEIDMGIKYANSYASRGRRDRRDIRRSDRDSYSRDQRRFQMTDDDAEDDADVDIMEREKSLMGPLSMLHGEPPSTTEVSYERVDWDADDTYYRAPRRSRSSPHSRLDLDPPPPPPRSPSLLYDEKPKRPQYRTPTPPLGTSPRATGRSFHMSSPVALSPSQSTMPFESFRSPIPQLRSNSGRQVRPGNYHHRSSPSPGEVPRIDYSTRLAELRAGKTASSMFPILAGKKNIVGNAAYASPRASRAAGEVMGVGCYPYL